MNVEPVRTVICLTFISCNMSYLYKHLQAHICRDFRLSWFWNDCLLSTWVAFDLRARDCNELHMRFVEKLPTGCIGLAALQSASSPTEIKPHHLQTNGIYPEDGVRNFIRNIGARLPKLAQRHNSICSCLHSNRLQSPNLVRPGQKLDSVTVSAVLCY